MLVEDYYMNLQYWSTIFRRLSESKRSSEDSLNDIVYVLGHRMFL